MNLLIHRGSHEIGGSCVEIQNGDTRLLIDIGMPLKNKDGEAFDFNQVRHLSGLELIEQKILPDIHGLYAWDIGSTKIDGVLLSHAHLDHYGFARYLRKDIHYYLGEGTKRLIDISYLFSGNDSPISHYTPIENKQPIQVGSIKITPYLMDHSAFDAYAFLIEANGKRLFYSGDFRSHGRKANVVKEFLESAPKNIDVLLLEGTNINQTDKSNKTEPDIQNEALSIIKNKNNIVFMIMSGQNIDRFVSFFKAAKSLKKIFVVDVYIAAILDALKDLAKLPFPSDRLKVWFPGIYKRIPEIERKEILYEYVKYKISTEDISKYSNNIVMIVRSSMQPFLRKLTNTEGGTVIYSMWGGYAKDNGSMKKFLTFLTNEKKMEVVHLHTSGHAGTGTLKQFVEALAPKTIIPIHTLNPEAYENLFSGRDILIANDGEVIYV